MAMKGGLTNVALALLGRWPKRGLKRWSMSQNYKTPELRFRALLTEGASRQLELGRA